MDFITVVVIIAIVYVLIKFSSKETKSSDQEQIEMNFNIDIYDEKTKKQANKDIKKLSSYLSVASDGSRQIINDAIDQIKDAIGEYEDNSNNNYCKTIPLDGYKVHLYYKDSKGDVSNRYVDIKEFDGVYISGYCNLRKQYRTFKVDRIKELFDGETGESIDMKNLENYFEKIYKESTLYELNEIFNKYYELLRVMMYLVKADGRYTAKEKVVVRNTLRSLTNSENDLSDEKLDKLMKWVEVPSLHSFKIAVGKVIKNIELPDYDLEDIANSIFSTKKKLHDNEEYALEYISKKINN